MIRFPRRAIILVSILDSNFGTTTFFGNVFPSVDSDELFVIHVIEQDQILLTVVRVTLKISWNRFDSVSESLSGKTTTFFFGMS